MGGPGAECANRAHFDVRSDVDIVQLMFAQDISPLGSTRARGPMDVQPPGAGPMSNCLWPASFPSPCERGFCDGGLRGQALDRSRGKRVW